MTKDRGVLLLEGLDWLGLQPEDCVVDDLLIYLDELIRWSRKMNLIGRHMRVEEIIEKHFIDSLTLLGLSIPRHSTFLDVGSGAGFPGLVCKVVRRDLSLTIVEPRLKRVSFLRHIVRTLDLHQVTVLDTRVEEMKMPSRTPLFTHITGRAVTELADFLTLISSCLHPEVQVICMKGPKWREEFNRATEVLKRTTLQLTSMTELKLPFSGAERVLLVFEHGDCRGG